MRKYISIFLILFGSSLAFASDPDILVTQEGESLKVYNVEVTPKTVYYTLTEDTDADVKKMAADAVLIIKKADGTVVNLVASDASNVSNNQETSVNKNANPDAHEPVTHKALEKEFVKIHRDKEKANKFFGIKEKPARDELYILAGDGKGQILNFRLLDDRTLAVAMSREIRKTDKKGKVKIKETLYEGEEYIIPDYVSVGDVTYPVTVIDPWAFVGCSNVKNIVFPSTLKEIGVGSFSCVGLKKVQLKRIILPEGLEKIGQQAFFFAGSKMFEQLYIPKGVKEIGKSSFSCVGGKTSYNGYFQGALTCCPDWITTGNCTQYGIDEEAVEAYERRKK